ncbi:hypothetical protein H9L12_05865 [Sphingomonas rhizophila]|uniref:Uncharacterized protein n=1 Tax=Sphingomonas rhizophila TaxID=2071607 RepID=A0A7G9SDU8_9SPHN|nr:hypothetical protein [Sphingomonas rhizophila]QNN66023.1 hypothetical protein H9L12_05865 [Sphingomonas rhizophila]
MRRSLLLVMMAAVGSVAHAAAPLDKVALRKAGASYYRCIAESKPVEATAFVLDRTTARTIYKTMGRAVDPACMKGDAYRYVETLRGNVDLIRYGVANALVRQSYPTTYPATMASAPALVHTKRPFDEAGFMSSARFRNLGPRALTEARQEKAVFDFMEVFGDCVVRRNPAAAHKFLLTDVASPDERAALGGLRPSLATCLPADRKATLDLDMIRGAVADNFIRLAEASRGASR